MVSYASIVNSALANSGDVDSAAVTSTTARLYPNASFLMSTVRSTVPAVSATVVTVTFCAVPQSLTVKFSIAGEIVATVESPLVTWTVIVSVGFSPSFT